MNEIDVEESRKLLFKELLKAGIAGSDETYLSLDVLFRTASCGYKFIGYNTYGEPTGPFGLMKNFHGKNEILDFVNEVEQLEGEREREFLSIASWKTDAVRPRNRIIVLREVHTQLAEDGEAGERLFYVTKEAVITHFLEDISNLFPQKNNE